MFRGRTSCSSGVGIITFTFAGDCTRAPDILIFIGVAFAISALGVLIVKGNASGAVPFVGIFTLIGATTRAGMLTSPLRDRFGISFRLELYTPEELAVIVMRSAKILRIDCDKDGALEIASRSRGTPRIANRLIRRVRDFAEVKAGGKIDVQVAQEALNMLEVDELGLDRTDREMITTMIEKFGGGPVISLSAVTDRPFTDSIIAICKDKEIPYGITVDATDTGTNATMVSLVGDGIATAVVSIPIGSMHTYNETVELSDVESTAKLFSLVLCDKEIFSEKGEMRYV